MKNVYNTHRCERERPLILPLSDPNCTLFVNTSVHGFLKIQIILYNDLQTSNYL